MKVGGRMPNNGDVRIDPLTDKEMIWLGIRWVVADEPMPNHDMTWRDYIDFDLAMRNAKPPLVLWGDNIDDVMEVNQILRASAYRPAL